jgi:hypothetical protein
MNDFAFRLCQVPSGKIERENKAKSRKTGQDIAGHFRERNGKGDNRCHNPTHKPKLIKGQGSHLFDRTFKKLNCFGEKRFPKRWRSVRTRYGAEMLIEFIYRKQGPTQTAKEEQEEIISGEAGGSLLSCDRSPENLSKPEIDDLVPLPLKDPDVPRKCYPAIQGNSEDPFPERDAEFPVGEESI